MEPLRIAFEDYALVGVTLLILAAVMLFFILRQPVKTPAAWLGAAFFAGVGLSGLSIVLTNGLVFWGRLFAPWQDFWLLAGGVALTRYAYAVPRDDQPREALAVLTASGALALGALAVCAWYSYPFFVDWSPALAVHEAYYLLLPLGTLVIVLLCLRRSVHLSRLEEASGGASAAPRRAVWRCLASPAGNDALLMRNLALGFSLAFLPALGFFLEAENWTVQVVKTIAQHLGALVAVSAIALAYLNYSPVITSFVVKLTGVSLLALMLMMAAFGDYHVLETKRTYDRDAAYLLAATLAELKAGQPVSPPPPVSYVVSWNGADLADTTAYRTLFARSGSSSFDFARLEKENRGGDLAKRRAPENGAEGRLTNDAWHAVPRWRTYAEGSLYADYVGHQFTQGATTYEIGVSQWHRLAQVSRVTVAWSLMLLAASALLLLLFPTFFNGLLVRPLADLLAGVRRVNAGALDTRVAVRHPDEIGQLTGAFKALTGTLKTSYGELEERIAARTRELSAFFDLSKLGAAGEPPGQRLEPTLDRIREATGCDALCLHLLGDDGRTLALAEQVGVPEAALARLQSVAVPEALAGRIRGITRPLTSGHLAGETALPPALRVAPFRSYLGTPLGPSGQVLGWLGCYRREGGGFGVSESALLVALARQIGVIVENHRLQQRTGQLAALEERQRLARDLHDSVTQLLYGLTLYSRAGREAALDGDTQRLESNLEKIADTASTALREMRALLFELQPPALEEAGLQQAIEQRLNLVERRVGLEIDALIDDSLAVPGTVARVLYHVALEALNNALRHAAADKLLVTLRRVDGDVELAVEDNGCGFDPATVRVGLGLSGMRARLAEIGGSLSLETAAGCGVRITARVPPLDNEVTGTDE